MAERAVVCIDVCIRGGLWSLSVGPMQDINGAYIYSCMSSDYVLFELITLVRAVNFLENFGEFVFNCNKWLLIGYLY